jgi:hypothetical protein
MAHRIDAGRVDGHGDGHVAERDAAEQYFHVC